MNILAEIAQRTRQRVADEKKTLPLSKLRQQAEAMAAAVPKDFPFTAALAAPGMSFICEVKKASPSKGLIAPDFPYRSIAEDYQAAGASAISCLTEPFWFQGSDSYLREIAQHVSIPVLRKDFAVDDYMIYGAKSFRSTGMET